MNLKIALLTMCSLAASAAHAQSTDQLIDRTESRLDRVIDREPRAVLALDGAAAKAWGFSLDLPFTWNSNITNADTDRTRAFHANPSIALGREWDLGGNAAFSFEAGTDSDLYIERKENNSSTAYGNARLTIGKAKGGVAAYFDYTMLGIFDGLYETHAVTLHHASVGAMTVVPAGQNGSVTFDANLLRREASIKAVEQTRGSLSAKYKVQADEKTALVFGLRGQLALYTGGVSEGRDDTSVRATAGISYDISDTASFGVAAKFDRNWSNAAGKDYSTWDVGPTLSLTAAF